MAGRCKITLNEVAYQIKIRCLRRHFFYVEGHNPCNHPEFHFILISRGKCELLLPDQPPILCPQNTLVMINPGFTHTFRTDRDGAEHSCLVGSFRDNNGGPYTEPLETLFDHELPVEPYRLVQLNEKEVADFLERLQRAIGLFQADEDSFAATASIADLFVLSMRLTFPDEFTPSPGFDRRQKIADAVREIVELEINDPKLSLIKIAGQLHLHPNYLNSLFRAAEDMPLGEYIIRRRLQRARQMLSGGTRIKDVAVNCGFSSHNYFSRLFRKRLNCTPREYQLEPERYHEHTADQPF